MSVVFKIPYKYLALSLLMMEMASPAQIPISTGDQSCFKNQLRTVDMGVDDSLEDPERP